MADFAPPAKKARLDVDADAPGSANLDDAPGSPVDDLDDDFYENSAADNAQSAVPLQDAPLKGGLDSLGDAPPTEPVSAAGAQIPGFGLWGEPAAQQQQQQPPTQKDGGSEDGELSDEENFYSEVNPDAPVAQQQPPVGDAPQLESKLSQPGLLSLFSQPVDGAEASAAAAPIPDGEVPKTLKRKASSPPVEAPDDDDAHLVDAITAAIANEDTADAQLKDDGKAEFLEAAAANKDNKDAEWELDSQASSSSSSGSSSDDSSSDEDGEASDDGELLSPAEMAKRLMEADPDEDDPSASKTTKVRTQNEVDEAYVKPDITIKDDTKITLVGSVESIVDNVVVIKANTSGDYYVLETGSALCLANRTVIGQVSETIGRVQDPRYSVGFADAAEIETLNIAKDTPIYYVDEHSSFVYTEPLRAQKHTDASGQYDEEAKVQEFSDDEQEAEHKRNLKQQKKARTQGAEEAPFNPPTGPSAFRERSPPNPSAYTGGGLKYSDDEDEDLGMYKPLARPDRFEDIVGAGAPLEDRSHVRRGMMRGGRGGWMDRGRGFRGRGGGGRGDRGGMGGHRGDRGDRGGMGGQRGGDRGDRGGMGRGGGRGDRADRGGRSFGGSPERPTRQEEQPRRTPLPPQHDVRPNFRAQFSPAGSPPQQDVGPSPRGGKKRNKKRNRRERERERREQDRLREQERERSSQPPATANATAYASNQAQSNSGWNSAPAPVPAPAPPSSYAQPPAPPPAQAPANYYVNPGVFPQQTGTVPPPAAAAQPQANQAQAWAQWLQIAAYMQQAQAQGGQPQAPPPPPPQPQAPAPAPAYTQYAQPHHQHAQPQQAQQAQAQYGYGYQQYQQPPQPPQPQPTPPADPRLQHHNPQQQAAQPTPSIQDILRALGQSSGR
ncbi:NAF1-domain-containing protein [Karstenula rhodostoma CBS 690.94]|uniref:H/ACA ribonucleoprotein complex non-core subunit NAF1 n=1 Tax=Karstenula rhodostoma CBS 690.94 TaxID=1392251 RepID=A0A9P4PN78_9PLEO|nr:NAF1-domain-containing protein [Karstenula rhodostoma CBS 690.94]